MLTRSNDRKVTNLVSPNGKSSKIANAFGLPAGIDYSCPGATSICSKVCYAGKLEKIYSGVKNVLVRNFEELLYADYLHGWQGMASLIDEMLYSFEKDCAKWNAPLKFRIHWDGDFWSHSYASAWAHAIESHPDIQFWVYTRSFGDLDVVPILRDYDNLTLYLSVDDSNRHIAQVKYPDVLWANLSETFAIGESQMEGWDTYKCPENKGSIPLISEKGSACVRCGICVEGRGDVLFSIGKR